MKEKEKGVHTKKLIAFSLWGDNPVYCQGAVKNAKLAKQLFKGWIPRFYCGTSVPNEIITQLKAWDAEVIIMQNQPGDWRGMFWRFEAAFDPEVDVMISRDCDSRLSLIEKNEVDRWLRTGKILHTIHAHPYHFTVPILGGMWGVLCADPGFKLWIRHQIENYNSENRYQTDQEFLQKIVWPSCMNSVCKSNMLAREPSVDFSFIGEPVNEDDIPLDPKHREAMKDYYMQVKAQHEIAK